jgi:hypothetical protein
VLGCVYFATLFYWVWDGRTPRYLECQFEERSEPVSVEAGTLLLGGGVGMIGKMCVVWRLCVFGCMLRLSHVNGWFSH